MKMMKDDDGKADSCGTGGIINGSGEKHLIQVKIAY